MTAFKENSLNAGELASCDRVSLTRLIPSIILAYYPLLSRAVRSSLRCGTPQHGLRCGSTKKKAALRPIYRIAPVHQVLTGNLEFVVRASMDRNFHQAGNTYQQ
ncbi:hypothetical protein ACU6C3_004813 [Escherichia coli]|nr:hypothetical protein [Salmonella enterica]EFF5412162.1 hypothetical protein [Escherichia coli]EHW1075229.1 hypothetical protein [Salmonella enterica subsp. enterica serovar Typhimurium]EFS4585982.1 hypothetical protein [Salmonella enterica]EIH6958139.1 hypothetical protein [Escherichia coli]